MKNNFVYVFILVILIKSAFLLLHHIQEDAFITWRVADNLLESGVMGFNGEEKISSSTTYLYTLISAFFKIILGDYFVNVFLILNIIFFAIGSVLLLKMFLPLKSIFFSLAFIIINIIPPSIKATTLGMEYTLIFFLFSGLLYFGVYKSKGWAYIVFPFLILWTRLDCLLFLGFVGLSELMLKRKLNYILGISSIVALASVLLFNYVYFGEIVNHTIKAKRLAYQRGSSISFMGMIHKFGYYGNFLRSTSWISIILSALFLVISTFSFFKLFKNYDKKKQIILTTIFLFGISKILIFVFILKGYFDWYYWTPRIFLFLIVTLYIFEYLPKLKYVLLSVGFLLMSFQGLQSYVVGFLEDNFRKKIAAYILNIEDNPRNEYILLEPAGIIPYYTKLKVYDDVGLVSHEVTNEMELDFENWWINTVKKYQPKYILTFPGNVQKIRKLNSKDSSYFNENYRLEKEFLVDDVFENQPSIIQKIKDYKLKGRNYYLYQKKS